jgi:hypothetical protein
MVASRIIRTAVQNLIGGVSQQANSVRLENQAEQADNCYTSVVDGLGKRQPTEHIRRLREIPTQGINDNALVHWINRDTSERYVVVIDNAHTSKPDRLKVFDVTTGDEVPVYGDTQQKPVNDSSWNYLAARVRGTSLPKDHLKVITIADTTLILNKQVTCKKRDGDTLTGGIHGKIYAKYKTDAYDAHVGNSKGGAGPNWKSLSARRGFLFLRSVNANTKYAVRMNVLTGPYYKDAAYVNTWDPPITAGPYPNHPNVLTAEEWIRISTAWVKTFDLDFKKHPPHNKVYSPTDIHITGWGDEHSEPPYTPVAGWPVKDSQHEGYMIATVNAHEVLKRLWSEWREGIHYLRQRGTGTAAYHTVSYYPGGIEHNFIRNSPLIRNPTIPNGSPTSWLYGENLGNVLGRGWSRTPPIRDQVMHLELLRWPENSWHFREKIALNVESQGEAETLIAFTDTVPKLSQLPLTCVPGHIVQVTGLEDVENDDYYVEFVADEGKTPMTTKFGIPSLVQGYWKESLASLSVPTINNSLMPMKLQRHFDGSGNAYFVLSQATWADKKVGDDDSNPDPSFIGNKIEDIFLWRNRLGFLTGSRFVMSEADEHYNFWRTTVKSLIDSDPIDIDAGHRRVADLRYAVPLEEDLVIFSDRTQFLVQGDPILTPRTASLAPATEYEAYEDVRPEVTGRGIFYAYGVGGGDYSQIDFFHRRADVSVAFAGFKSTAQVPRYIKGKIVEMSATSIESVLAVRTDDSLTRNHIYIHKFVDRGNDRILSAWMKFIVGGDTTSADPPGCKIHGMQFIEDELHLLIERKGDGAARFNLEKITFSGPRQPDILLGGVSAQLTESAYRCCVDRRVSHLDIEAAATKGVYDAYARDANNGILEIRLPYIVSDDTNIPGGRADVRIVSGPGSVTGPEGELFSSTLTERSFGTPARTLSVLSVPDESGALYAFLTVTENFTFFVGETYTMTFEFSEPTLRERKQDGSLADIKTGRYQLLRGTLAYEDTGYFELEVTPKIHSDGSAVIDRDSRTHVLPLLEVGLGRSKVGGANIRDGVMRFGIYSSPDLVRLILTNDSPYPCNPKSLEIEANYTRRSRMSTY